MSSATFQPKGGFRPKLLALSVAACFGLSSTQTLANPTGGSVSSGSASFAGSGNTLTVTNSANAIINWQSFSIGVNEITRFVQSSASSAVLNRVVGANGVIPQSVIDGVLSSNGRVFLINQSGILFGANARIDVAGLVASSLNLSDRDFLVGRMRFTETPGAGGVSNAGVIDTTSGGAGGRVFLVGPDVQNSGIIRSPQGEIVLAAGKSVELVSEGSPFVTVHLVADAEQALNVGQLISDSGRIGMFGALVRQGGVVEANSAVAGANGEIRLVATKDLTLDAGSLTTANGPSGGNVLLQAEGGTNLISGTVEAKGSSGQGGTIQALGVRVGVIGAGVIDASGDAGGGTVLVGGDAHGANPNVQNAQQTLIGPDGIIRADAGTTGDGGRVIVWSDDYTRFFGAISARGGSRSGNGGFVETSGATLNALGSVDTSASNGKGGSWLLDPDLIEIVLTGGNALLNCATLTPALCFDDPLGGTSQISLATIDGGLRTNGSVTLQAHVDINLLTDLVLNLPGNFTAQAGNNINLGAFNITAAGTNITLIANDAASLTQTGKGGITSALGFGNITTGGGSVNLFGAGVAVGNITASGGLSGAGSVFIGAAAQPVTNDIVTGSITTASATSGFGGGSVSLVTQSGNITVNGTIDTRGATGSSGNFNGSNGGSVTLQRIDATVAGAVKVSGSILTYGGDGVVDQISGQGGFGGSAGDVTIGSAIVVPCTVIDCLSTIVPTQLNGDVLVGGGIIARGGNGAGSNPNTTSFLPNNGGDGGFGGSVSVLALGKVVVGSVDVSGGAGGAGSAAVPAGAAAPISSGLGGAGGIGGSADIEGGTVNVGGSILANGGAGGKGGDGVTGVPSIAGADGGLGGSGGDVFLFGAISASTTGALSASGGTGGVGGAYGGAGGAGGLGGFVLAAAPGGSIAPTIDVSGGAGGAGGAGNNVSGGIGGNGGDGGFALVVGDTIDLSKGGVITAAGGVGGAGGAGVSGGNGGNGGNGGLIELTYGSSILFTAPLVSGGAGGLGGVTGGVPGVKGADGTILISMLTLDFNTPPPEVTLASNTAVRETNLLTTTSTAPSIQELEKKDNDSKQKKGAAVCK